MPQKIAYPSPCGSKELFSTDSGAIASSRRSVSQGAARKTAREKIKKGGERKRSFASSRRAFYIFATG